MKLIQLIILNYQPLIKINQCGLIFVIWNIASNLIIILKYINKIALFSLKYNGLICFFHILL